MQQSPIMINLPPRRADVRLVMSLAIIWDRYILGPILLEPRTPAKVHRLDLYQVFGSVFFLSSYQHQ